ncbi:hypothetical protein L228DRAFT_126710 [Xylona heveae TC161]|uniref:DUF7918 domain-containing protein n=1 Tax=Xylona heveae (strain CBS 132557 / TC161) TaxID=1328760 RepID=A0A165GQN6_XYLHT|nr:hypothetical protein L228DRAFT_126710 [Xylona heveae TC161]KZF22475.1 hypothetical protein L228DRAFT_126710 [Xylona heveae TC161]
MPCFKGLAVSIHTPDGPLPEYSIQKQSKYSRITSYIPVPPPRIPPDSTTKKPEQSTFAISITLLTPGLTVPYSTPKPTEEEPFPKPKYVGELPGYGSTRGRYTSSIGPYIALTGSPNETVAAYIYFDGRQKEEVATLLRRGEETWVNSRWVSVPESEGGGLAEREFLFREVGLERWLNGLDLEGKDAAATIEKRRQRLERKLRKKREAKERAAAGSEMDMEKDSEGGKESKGVLRYGADERAPIQRMTEEDGLFSSDSDSEDEPPMPEAAGQIKVALFRVLASGEIKKGEYSPQFDAHDDDEDSQAGSNGNAKGSGGGDADVDHTTSFAKPKTLDPKSISTQTVTGIDGPDKPYAVFTFLYRGERQLQKMGILPSSRDTSTTPASGKRKSVQTDFSKLGPLNTRGTVGFAAFRDNDALLPSSTYKKGKSGKSSRDAMDSDDEDDDAGIVGKLEDIDNNVDGSDLLSPEDAKRQGELTEGLRNIKLKRQHSADPLSDATPPARKSPALDPSVTVSGSTPPTFSLNTPVNAGEDSTDAIVGSPLKKQRASLSGLDEEMMRKRLETGPGSVKESGIAPKAEPPLEAVKKETVPATANEDEEL